MISTFEEILRKTIDHLASVATTYVPALLTGAVLFAIAAAIALLARWLILRVTRAEACERFLVHTGLCDMLPGSGGRRAAKLIAAAVYWSIVTIGSLLAISAFDTQLTTRIVDRIVDLAPKIGIAAGMVIGGLWLARYLGRSLLVWACNAELPYPRCIAGVGRALVVFGSIAAASEHLGFAPVLFLSVFLITAGALALAAGIAAGIGIHDVVRQRLGRTDLSEREDGLSIWRHV